jgi:predicted transcriptional regulator/transcriptional regulator with XRE-family HTH domain
MARPAPGPRLFAGDRIKQLRIQLGLSQSAMAARIAISTSYLSQIENGDRPITEPVLARLSRSFPRHWGDIDAEEDSVAMLAAIDAAVDPVVPAEALTPEETARAYRQQPRLARRMAALHAALRRSHEQLRVLDDKVETRGTAGTQLPWEEVRDWFQDAGNYIDALDRAAEALSFELDPLPHQITTLARRLKIKHGVDIRPESAEANGAELRAFDQQRGVLTIDVAQPPESRAFQAAHQLARLENAALIEQIVQNAALQSEAARQLLRVGLANYAAGALLMPYNIFRETAHRVRHDIDRLRRHFSVSFEQACHRLSTLQRPGRQGIPFFFCRIDMAGNITKRHSATRLRFAQFGGTCPLWAVHEAVSIPDRILVQLAETPDGIRYVSMAKGLVKPTASYRRAPRRYAVALGCEIEHAADFIYGDGLDLTGVHSATPIGSSCRICPRRDCDQRAFPPVARTIIVDPDSRSLVPYSFE